MKVAAIWLFAQATSIVCALGAVWLAYHGKDGWGWLIFAAIVTHCSSGDSSSKAEGK